MAARLEQRWIIKQYSVQEYQLRIRAGQWQLDWSRGG